MAQKSITDIDRLVGARVRAIRTARGLTQTDLANLVGVTYQQIQKYEVAANRISFSTLSSISKALSVPIAKFYESAAQKTDPSPSSKDEEAVLAFMGTREGLELCRAFLGIKSQTKRKRLVAMLSALADSEMTS